MTNPKSFNNIAETYHKGRPGYPTALFEEVKEICGITSESRLLEIGAGSGIASKELAKYGAQLVVLEPGAELMAIAKKELEGVPHASFVQSVLEDYEPEALFDTALSFTAFHWVTGDKFGKAAEMLKQGGHLVLVWNSFRQSEEPVSKETGEIYHAYLPDIFPRTDMSVNERAQLKVDTREEEIKSDDRFALIAKKEYESHYQHDAESFCNLLMTYPVIEGLGQERRKRFLDAMAEVVRKHGSITVPVKTVMFICKKK